MTPATEDNPTLSAEPMRETQVTAAEKGDNGLLLPAACSFPGAQMGRALLMRRSLLLAGFVLLLPVVGCGTGLTGFTNDGIPEGKSVIKGQVLAADNPQQPLTNLSVTVVSTPPGEPTASYRVTTDANGAFTINGVNTGKPAKVGQRSVSNVVVSVDPARLPYQKQKVSLLLTQNRPATVILALPPTAFDLNQVGGISVQSTVTNTSAIATGSVFQFTARLLDHNNNPIVSQTTGQYFVPNLVLQDLTITGIGANGLFQASGSTVGVSSIVGTISIPGQDQPVTSDRIDVPIELSPAGTSGGVQQIAPGVPTPPAPPRATSSATNR